MKQEEANKLRVGDMVTWHGRVRPLPIKRIVRWDPSFAQGRPHADKATEEDYPMFLFEIISTLSGKPHHWDKPVNYYWLTPLGD